MVDLGVFEALSGVFGSISIVSLFIGLCIDRISAAYLNSSLTQS